MKALEPFLNKITQGDNLDIMRDIDDESVDLIYLDPPFNSGKNNKVFDDTWHWNIDAKGAYRDIVTKGQTKLAELIQALRSFLGSNDMMAYLTMMAIRLAEMRRVLKPTGSIYLHCDPTASHYLKILMDAVFGAANFQNEIIWAYKSGGATNRRFSRKHDILFFYSKDPTKYQFNSQKEKSYMMHEYGFKSSNFQKDEKGQYAWVIMKDWWEIPSIGSADKQRLGYPTQKPERLLERIIKASSNEGDIVADFFCGCGTTIAVAERLKRRWIGMDITHLAINLTRRRIKQIQKELI